VNFRDEFLNQTEQDDPKFPFAVVRNKTDLYDEGSSVTEQKSEQYFNEHFGQTTCKHFSTSAKDGSGVEDLFVWIAKTVSQKGDEADNDSYDPDDDRVELRQVEPEEIETKKYNCCKST
jgi:GTPase SAR1 family protein